MTEVNTTEAPAAKTNLVKRVAAALFLVLADGTKLKAAKYVMPLKAARIPVTINGAAEELAETTFKEIKYTYFTVNGVCFWVSGHIDDKSQDLGFEFPDGYEFKPMKLDRKDQADKAKAAKAAKAPAKADAEQASASAESPLAGDETGAAGGSLPSGDSEPVAAPAPKGKKAKR